MNTSPKASAAGRTLRAAHKIAGRPDALRLQLPPSGVKPGELVQATFPDGTTMTAAARKTFILLLLAAGSAAGEDREHAIAKQELRGTHNANERISRTLDELQRVLLRIRVKSPAGRDAVMVAPIVSQRIEETADDSRAMVWWRFSEPMRRILADSSFYATLQKQIVLSLESRYAVTLYEVGSLVLRRNEPVWRGTIEQFREQFGVPGGKLARWNDLRRFVLEPAVAEVSQLASFDLGWSEFRHAGKVIGLEIRFWPKDADARSASARELNGSRVGRKARREGAVERASIDPALRAALDALSAGEAPPE